MKRRIPALFNADSGINPWGAIAMALFTGMIAVFALGGLALGFLAFLVLAGASIECGYDGPCSLGADFIAFILVLVGVGLFYIGLSLWSVIWGIRIVAKGSMGLIRAAILIGLVIPLIFLARTQIP